MNNIPITEKSDTKDALYQIISEYIKEQKRKRRWRWFGRIALLVFLAYLAYHLFTFGEEKKALYAKPHAGLIDLNGTIFDAEAAGAENFAKSIKLAYKSPGLKGLIIRINSPGGSPVQADYIYNTLQFYRKQYPNVKTYAVCVDICASAAYYVAAGTDEIYANPSSLVGSIGVLYNGFGFVEAMQKLGIARRLHTAGKNKGFLDPFSKETPEQVQLLGTMLNEIHSEFIAKVKKGRGQRLKIDKDTFSGLFWTGKQARERGLVDGFSSSGQLAHEVMQVEKIIDYTYKQGFLERFSKNLGTAVANQLAVVLGVTPKIS